MSVPKMRTVPEVFFSAPQTAPMSVVLPAPFGPRSARISPARISRLTPASAVCFGYRLTRSLISSAIVLTGAPASWVTGA